MKDSREGRLIRMYLFILLAAPPAGTFFAYCQPQETSPLQKAVEKRETGTEPRRCRPRPRREGQRRGPWSRGIQQEQDQDQAGPEVGDEVEDTLHQVRVRPQ